MKYKIFFRGLIFSIVTVFLMVLMLIFEKRNALVSGICTCLIIVNTIVYIVYIMIKNRCPHCGAFIRYYRGDFCSHCGEKLN